MATTRLPPDFKDFLKLLNAHRVEYLLIGGYAVGYHGYPRATADMDIWVARTPENARKLLTVLRDFGFQNPETVADAFLKENRIISLPRLKENKRASGRLKDLADLEQLP